MRAKPKTNKRTVVRTYRIDPDLYEAARRAADWAGESVGDLVRVFLDDYVHAMRGYMQLGLTPDQIQDKPYVAANLPFVPPPASTHILSLLPVDPRVCGHLTQVQLSIGSWCKECGIRLS